jgi:hypothetical protein
VLGPVGEGLFEQLPPGAVAEAAQVAAGEKRYVEQVVGDSRCRTSVERVLQGVEVGAAAVVRDDDLSIEPSAVDAERRQVAR